MLPLSTQPHGYPFASASWRVPPEHLERLPRDMLRGLERHDCALLLDGYLRRLARQEAACRHVLGRTAAAFLRLKAHHRLAFARLGDYTRERLGVSARELQSAAHVVTKLDALPAASRAFKTGVISWTHARALVDVATSENEAAWVECTRTLTVRALEDRIRAGTGSSGDDTPADEAPPAQPPHVIDEDGGRTLEVEPAVRVRIGCPRRVRALWRATVELARRMAGEPLPLWEAGEAIAAEGLTSSAARCNASGDSRTKRFTIAGAPADGDSSTESNAGAEGQAGERVMRDAATEGRGDGTCNAAGEAHLDGAEQRSDAFGLVDWDAISAAVPQPLAPADDLDVPDALDAFQLDARMRATIAAMHRVHWQTGRLLRLVFDLRLYHWLGFRTAAQYVKERLGIGLRTAEMLVAVERVTWRAPQLASAYERGEISPLRALIIAPVLSATHETAWLARAREVTIRRLGDEVTWALNHQDARPLCEPVAPPAAGRLVMPSEAQMRARFDDETPDIVISLPAPASVAALLEAAIAAFTAAGEPRWRGFERLLEHVRTEWNARPRHPDPVFARDGWRCGVPTCSARRSLHDHHIVFRSRGGDNRRTNRVALCAAHHQHGLHGGGYIRAWREAPDRIHWELGTRPGAAPLLTIIGDRYVS